MSYLLVLMKWICWQDCQKSNEYFTCFWISKYNSIIGSFNICLDKMSLLELVIACVGVGATICIVPIAWYSFKDMLSMLSHR